MTGSVAGIVAGVNESVIDVRDATPADLPAVAAIYTHYVLNTTITFNIEVRTPREWTERFKDIENGSYDLLVAERDGDVLGYVETARFRPKKAYEQALELSVYVAPDATGAGVGRRLYDTLLTRLEADERFHRAYAVIALPNDTSTAFHERAGFVHRGTLTEAGFKFGRYLDVAFYERAL